MLDKSRIISTITSILRDSLALEPSAVDEDLVAAGSIDSVGFIELFAHLEREFSISITHRDLNLDHFRSVDRLANFVLSKRRDAECAQALGADGRGEER